jgi:RNA polymerase sigma-70 factor (sigma-E family)
MQQRGGDAAQREFERFVTERTDPLLRTAFLMAWDLPEAEDLVQETLLRVARSWHRIRGMDHPGAYARRILVNLAIDGRQRRGQRSRELDPAGTRELAGHADTRAERQIAAVDTQAELLAAMAVLPVRQRAVIVLRYWEDLPEAEVAAILGCSPGTVKSTASRGLARLRAALQAETAEQPGSAGSPERDQAKETYR